MDFFKTKKNKPFDFLTLKYHTLGNKYIVSIFKKELPFFSMLCVPAKSPDGSRRPAQGTNPHKHKTEWEVCTKRGLDSTPEACKCTRRHSQHTEGRWYTGSGCWLSAAVLIKQEDGPWTSCLWINDRAVHSLSWGPSSFLYPAGGVSTVVGLYGSGLDLEIWGPVNHLEFKTVS